MKITTNYGIIVLELDAEKAPESAKNFQRYVESGHYNGTVFHRVIPGFMIQGGDPNSRDRDPTNDGKGRRKMQLADEFSVAPFVRGVVGMGNKGRENSTSSQFFIMQQDRPDLDGRYTVIGRVVSGMQFVDEITRVAIDQTGRWGPKHRPIEDVVMKRVSLEGPIAALAGRIATDPGGGRLETD